MVMSIKQPRGCVRRLANREIVQERVRVVTPTADEHPPEDQHPANEPVDVRRRKKRPAHAGTRQPETL